MFQSFAVQLDCREPRIRRSASTTESHFTAPSRLNRAQRSPQRKRGLCKELERLGTSGNRPTYIKPITRKPMTNSAIARSLRIEPAKVFLSLRPGNFGRGSDTE